MHFSLFFHSFLRYVKELQDCMTDLLSSDAHCLLWFVVLGMVVDHPVAYPFQISSNVYYVHASYGPFSLIVKPILNHSNYHD